MAFSPGTQLGPYEIVGLLGVGGMGEVYRARDPRLGREVAVKVLPPGSSAHEDRLRRFEQEARAAGALNHPNLLAVLDVGTDEGSPYIVSELLEGETLRERLGGGALPVRKVIDYATQISQGLGAAHARGIVHRDLKPENLFVTRDGRVKILDFGLAKLAPRPQLETEEHEGPTRTRRTGPGVVMGTVGYMSPEQVLGRSADHRSDLFSLGSILYEMLTGRRAFQEDSGAETMTAILRKDPIESPSHGIPPGLERVVRHCLEKSAEERFQSARDLGFALEAVSSFSGATLAPSPDIEWRRRRGLTALVAAVALLSLLAISFMLGSNTGVRPIPSFQRLTFRRGTVSSARFAPDGHTIVYGATWEGAPTRLHSSRTDGRDSNRLDLPDADIASVSSTGEMAILLGYRLAFNDGTPGTLARVPLAGGAPREILNDVAGADWSPDGQSLAVVRRVGSRWTLEFPIGQILYESSDRLRSPRVSPRGDRVAFFTQTSTGGTVDVVDLSGTKTTLSSGWKYTGNSIVWSPAGDEVWFAMSDGDWFPPVRAVSLSGKERVLIRLPAWVELQDISPDGRALMAIGTLRADIQAFDAGENQERNLSWHESSAVADLSSDGQTLLFNEWAEGTAPALYLRKTDGSPAVRLGEGWGYALSPDGRWAITQRELWSDHLELIPTGVGEPRGMSGDGVRYENAIWFPDGKRILANGHEEGRLARCYIQDLDGGKPRPMTPEGTVCGVLSPDGKEAACTDSDGKGALYPMEGGEPRPIDGLEPGDVPFQWSADGRSLYMRVRQWFPVKVFQLNLGTGRRKLFLEIMPADPTALS